MRKPISSEKLSENFTLALCYRSSENLAGFWLYDHILWGGINLAMGAESREAALIEALVFYQEKYDELSKNNKKLKAKVDSFVSQFIVDED